MVPPRPMIASKWRKTGLLGARQCRVTKRIVLQVEEARRNGFAGFTMEWFRGLEIRWRDATLDDLVSVSPPVARDERALLPSPTEAA